MKDFDIRKRFWEQERYNTDLYKAYNVLNLQLNSLTYNYESGADYDYFINNDIPFKKQSFINYVVKTLIEQNCDVVYNMVQKQDYAMINEIFLNKQINKNEGLF